MVFSIIGIVVVIGREFEEEYDGVGRCEYGLVSSTSSLSMSTPLSLLILIVRDGGDDDDDDDDVVTVVSTFGFGLDRIESNTCPTFQEVFLSCDPRGGASAFGICVVIGLLVVVVVVVTRCRLGCAFGIGGIGVLLLLTVVVVVFFCTLFVVTPLPPTPTCPCILKFDITVL